MGDKYTFSVGRGLYVLDIVITAKSLESAFRRLYRKLTKLNEIILVSPYEYNHPDDVDFIFADRNDRLMNVNYKFHHLPRWIQNNQNGMYELGYYVEDTQFVVSYPNPTQTMHPIAPVGSNVRRHVIAMAFPLKTTRRRIRPFQLGRKDHFKIKIPVAMEGFGFDIRVHSKAQLGEVVEIIASYLELDSNRVRISFGLYTSADRLSGFKISNQLPSITKDATITFKEYITEINQDHESKLSIEKRFKSMAQFLGIVIWIEL